MTWLLRCIDKRIHWSDNILFTNYILRLIDILCCDDIYLTNLLSMYIHLLFQCVYYLM